LRQVQTIVDSVLSYYMESDAFRALHPSSGFSTVAAASRITLLLFKLPISGVPPSAGLAAPHTIPSWTGATKTTPCCCCLAAIAHVRTTASCSRIYGSTQQPSPFRTVPSEGNPPSSCCCVAGTQYWLAGTARHHTAAPLHAGSVMLLISCTSGGPCTPVTVCCTMPSCDIRGRHHRIDM
jgi:hypothetical protein